MCGITGIISEKSRGSLGEICRGMADAMIRRGPDAGGVWADESVGVALGHRRLSIIDLSNAGAQPMVSADGRCVIVYNGEVFNFQELKSELEAQGIQFKGHSDTEVVLEACRLWGVDAASRRFIGMFAFAFWDSRTQRLFLCRDRAGVKPLFWSHQDGRFVFGSELKALRACRGWSGRVDRDSLCDYLDFGYISAPHSIYENVRKLTPGHILECVPKTGQVYERPYWELSKIVEERPRLSFANDEDALRQLDDLLIDAVKRRMVADVPLGAFLSGGVDSSLITAIMQRQSAAKVRTFAIGFNEKKYDEAPFAESVADYLGTDHTSLHLTVDMALEIVPSLPDAYDEPMADASALPTMLLAQLTRKYVTVALSGDGGDELFCGYARYFDSSYRNFLKLAGLPDFSKALLRGALRSLSPKTWDRLLPEAARRRNISGHTLHVLADGVLAAGREPLLCVASDVGRTDGLLLSGKRHPHPYEDASVKRLFPDLVERMQYVDATTYMIDDCLVKVDRATMYHSLESRVPLLDYRVEEFAFRLPFEYKLRGGVSKWILRNLLYKYVPQTLIERPKAGFAVPIPQWITGGLKGLVHDMLAPARLKDSGLWNVPAVERMIAQNERGERNWSYILWKILLFELWRDRYL